MGLIDQTQRVIYLDNASTTPCDPRAVEAMSPYWFTNFGNPSSPHMLGKLSNQVIEDCREQICKTLHGSGDVIFTSGSTESNNMAIVSALRYSNERLNRRRVLCLSTEHKSIINAVTYFGDQFNMTVDWIPVTTNGKIDMTLLPTLIDDSVGVVIVQLANSETGVVQDVADVSAMSHRYGALCVSDVTQAVGRIDVDLDRLGVDFASFTAHKFYGPKGIGALYLAPKVELAPLMFGGGQERGTRPGTENVPGVIGLTTALRLGVSELSENKHHIAQLRDRLWLGIQQVEDIRWNGEGTRLLPSHLNVTVDRVNAQDLMLRVRNIAFSAGSACNTASNLPSPVLLNMGLSREEAEQTIRLSIGRFNTNADINSAVENLIYGIGEIRLSI